MGRRIIGIVSKNWPAVLLVVIGTFFRLYRLPEFITFLGDQGRDATIIKRIITLEHLPLIGPPSSVGGVYLGPFYYYFISPFLALFNFDPVGLAYGVAILSIIGLAVTYFIVSKYTSRFLGFIYLTLLTFSFVNIEQSRYSWNPNLLPFFSFLTLFFLYLFVKKPSKINSILLGGFFALSIQLHYLALSLVFPIIYFTLETFKDQDKKNWFRYPIFASISFILISAPLLIFDLKHEFLNTGNFLKFFARPEGGGQINYVSRIYETSQAFFAHVFQYQFQVLAIISLMAFVVVFFLKLKKDRSNLFIRIHSLAVITFLVFFSFLNSQRLEHYYGTIYLSFLIIVAYVVSELKVLNVHLRSIIILIFFATYIFLQSNHYFFLTGRASNQLAEAKTVAYDLAPNIIGKVIQTLPLPKGATDGHIRYFLELAGHTALPNDSTVQPDELYVFCFSAPCEVLGNPEWLIASFQNKKLDKIIRSQGIIIYKIVHEK